MGADSREVMNIRQASQYLGVSPDTLYKYVYEEKIPAFKLGNRWKFKKTILDQWMERKSTMGEGKESKKKPQAARPAPGQQRAAKYIPCDISGVTKDYQALTDDPAEPQMDVLLVAVKKDKILNYTNVLNLAGRAPAVVDIDAFALQNCYEYNYEPSPTSTVALLNLGASVMNINIVKGTTPLFTRDVSVGGNQYNDSLHK